VKCKNVMIMKLLLHGQPF